jgi:hypothetical protein
MHFTAVANLIACGAKQIETRSGKTSYRGKIAIHTGMGMQYFNHVIAIAKLVDCTKVSGRVSLKVVDEKMEYVVLENGVKITGNEFEFGDYTYGRYAWLLDNVQRIDPVPAKA